MKFISHITLIKKTCVEEVENREFIICVCLGGIFKVIAKVFIAVLPIHWLEKSLANVSFLDYVVSPM